MRHIMLVLAAVVASACGGERQSAQTSACARSATHQATWTNSDSPHVIVTRADGPTCAQAVVTFVLRDGRGDPLWAIARTYYDMTVGGIAPENAPAVSDEEMDRFLAGWADVTQMTSSALPAWREDAATLAESADTFSYHTAFERESYERLRASDLPMLCYAAAAEATQCLIIDPASHAPTVLAAYGP